MPNGSGAAGGPILPASATGLIAKEISHPASQSQSAHGFLILDRQTKKGHGKNDPKKPEDPGKTSGGEDSSSDSSSEDEDQNAPKSDPEANKVDQSTSGVPIIQPKSNQSRFKRVKLEKKYIKERWSVMELTPTHGDPIANAAPDNELNTIRRIKIIKTETPGITNIKLPPLTEITKKPENEKILASVMTIMKGFVKPPEPVIEPPKPEDPKAAEIATDPVDQPKPAADPPKPVLEKPKNLQKPGLVAPVVSAAQSGGRGPPVVAPSEHESTEDKIGSSMDIVKNFVVDLVRGAMRTERLETERLRIENAEMREEIEIIRALMSPEQINELEKEKNNIRKKKNENERNSTNFVKPEFPQINNNPQGAARKLSTTSARTRPEPRLLNPQQTLGDNLEAKTLALRGLNQPGGQGLTLNHNHVVNQLFNTELKNTDWTGNGPEVHTGNQNHQNPNSGKMENGINEHIRGSLYRQQINQNLHDVPQQRSHYGSSKMSLPGGQVGQFSGQVATSLPSHTPMTMPRQYHSPVVNGFHPASGSRPPPVNQQSQQRNPVQYQNVQQNQRTQQPVFFENSGNQQNQQNNSQQYYASYNTAQ